MKVVDCRGCGSKELVREAGLLRCTYCQSTFVPESDDVPRTAAIGTGLAADIRALLDKCEQDPMNRRRYASLVLDLDPTNEEARRHLS